MIGAILGALASAPLAVAAGASKLTGDALKIGAQDGKIPILAAAGETLSAAGDAGLGMAGDVMGNMSQFNLGGQLTELGHGMMGKARAATSSLSPGSAEVSQSLSKQIEEPQLTTKFCVSQGDLGNLTPGCGGGGTREVAGLQF